MMLVARSIMLGNVGIMRCQASLAASLFSFGSALQGPPALALKPAPALWVQGSAASLTTFTSWYG